MNKKENQKNIEKQKPIMREVQLLSYHAALCPHCKERIYIPEYRIQPGTGEDLKKHAEESVKMFRV